MLYSLQISKYLFKVHNLAVYELLETNTPTNVIIDEAIEITKEYSNLEDDSQSKFTNRLLDDIKEKLKRCE